MTNDTSTWLILALAAMGVTAAIAVFLKTPKERRYRGSPPAPLDEQLKTLPASAQAVIIKGNKQRALIKSAPYILIGIVLVGYSMWIKDTSHPECIRLMGINASYISLLLVCYGLPVGFLLVSLAYVGTGIKTVKSGRFPPLDTVVFNDTVSKKGASSIFRGILLLALPVFSLFLVYLGNSAYSEIAKEMSMYEITENLEAKCQ
jgi:uncharacterized membrane protein